MKKVLESPEYSRDPKSGAILLTDTSAINRYKRAKESRKNLEASVDLLEKRVQLLEKAITEMQSKIGRQ